MHSTLVSGWNVTNLGPLTTTYTAPSSCSTDNAYIQIGLSYLDEDNNSTSIIQIGAACNQPVPSVGSCLPSGAKLDEAYSTIDTNKVGAGYSTVAYYSPALACPSGWATVGGATKAEGGSITSSGRGFENPRPTDNDYSYVDNVAPNVLLAGMDEGDTAILCCPSSFTVDGYGGCSSVVSSYSVPTEYCVRYIESDGDDDEFPVVNTTLSIWGTTVTGSANVFPTTGTATISTETTTLHTPIESYVGVSYQAMMYLVHDATETAEGSSSAKSSGSTSPSSAASTNARGLQLAPAAVVVLTLVAAFMSGFALLMA